MPIRTGKRDWLWGLVLGLIVVLAVGGVYISLRGSDIKTYATVADVKCQSSERLDFHEHAHLSIFIRGEVVPVAANIGVRDECLFWLHTHDDSGLLHIEAPEEMDFKLGQFFQVWGQPLSDTALLEETVGPGEEITAVVNGEAFTGDPADIELGDQQTIVLQIGPPFGTAEPSPFESP